MPHPLVVGCVLQPEDSVVVSHARHNVGSAIAVHIHHMHKPQHPETPIRMKNPLAVPWIGGSFEPSFRSQNVSSAIPIHIACANSMPIAGIADRVLPNAAMAVAFIPGERMFVAELRKNFSRLAVVIQVHQE